VKEKIIGNHERGAGQQKSMEKQRQQRKATNSSKFQTQLPKRGEGKLKTRSQGKPDGPGDRLAILATR
jgi:hypothetical protein